MNHTVESILVPTDGSTGAKPGERRGVDLAATLGADLHTLSVVDTRDVDTSLTNLNPESQNEHKRMLEGQAETAVSAVARLAEPHLSGDITTSVQHGLPFRTITEYAETNDIDIIVMGTHGRTGVERVLLGSVAEKTLRTSNVPVVAVPPTTNVVELGDIVYDDILIPTDGSQGADIAIDWGLTLASVYDATVHAVYSVDTSGVPEGPGMSQIHDTLERTGRNALKTVRERARAADISVSGHLGTGPADSVIHSYSEEHEIDLIVMGTHGRTGIERFILGSVTEKVVRTAAVPVCCVPVIDE